MQVYLRSLCAILIEPAVVAHFWYFREELVVNEKWYVSFLLTVLAAAIRVCRPLSTIASASSAMGIRPLKLAAV